MAFAFSIVIMDREGSQGIFEKNCDRVYRHLVRNFKPRVPLSIFDALPAIKTTKTYIIYIILLLPKSMYVPNIS